MVISYNQTGKKNTKIKINILTLTYLEDEYERNCNINVA